MKQPSLKWRKTSGGKIYLAEIVGVGTLAVHRHIDSPSDMWHVTARWIDLVSAELEACDLGAAQVEAVGLIYDALHERMNEDTQRALVVERLLPT